MMKEKNAQGKKDKPIMSMKKGDAIIFMEINRDKGIIELVLYYNSVLFST